MKNTLELELRELRPLRVLKANDAGEPEFLDAWAIHRNDRAYQPVFIAVKFGREVAGQAAGITTGTLFTIKGRLHQSKNPKTGAYHTFVWADEILDVVPSKKKQPAPPGPEQAPELDLPEAGQEEENPEPEIPHA